jgi:hypothetical protein
MKKWVVTSSRDIFCLLLLIGLSRYAVQRIYQDHTQAYRAQVSAEPFTVHELNQAFLIQLEAAKAQVQQAAQKVSINTQRAAEVQAIAQELETIYHKYTNNSPALALLGPIGTTAIVLKEYELEKRLRKALSKLGSLLTKVEKDSCKKNIDSLSELLCSNQKLLDAFKVT